MVVLVLIETGIDRLSFLQRGIVRIGGDGGDGGRGGGLGQSTGGKQADGKRGKTAVHA